MVAKRSSSRVRQLTRICFSECRRLALNHGLVWLHQIDDGKANVAVIIVVSARLFSRRFFYWNIVSKIMRHFPIAIQKNRSLCSIQEREKKSIINLQSHKKLFYFFFFPFLVPKTINCLIEDNSVTISFSSNDFFFHSHWNDTKRLPFKCVIMKKNCLEIENC